MAKHVVYESTETTWSTPTKLVEAPTLVDFTVDIDAIYWLIETPSSGGSGGNGGNDGGTLATIFRRPIATPQDPGTQVYQGAAASSLISW